MIPGFKPELPGSAPYPGFNVVLFIPARWYILIRKVGNTGKKPVQGILNFTQLILGPGFFLLELFDLLQQRLDVLARSLGFSDRSGMSVLLALKGFRTNLNGPAALFQGLKHRHIKFKILDGQPAGDFISLGTDTFRIEHDLPEFSGERNE